MKWTTVGFLPALALGVPTEPARVAMAPKINTTASTALVPPGAASTTLATTKASATSELTLSDVDDRAGETERERGDAIMSQSGKGPCGPPA